MFGMFTSQIMRWTFWPVELGQGVLAVAGLEHVVAGAC